MSNNTDKVFEAIGDIKGDIVHLKMDTKDTKALMSIKDNLDVIFPDAKCEKIVLTDNTDKRFFGIVVMPILDSDQIMEIAISDKNLRVKRYKVELDNRLFGNYIGLNFDEIESLLIHEVGVLVSDDTPGRKVRFTIDQYLNETGERMKISEYISYVELLGFGIKDAMRRLVSVFYNEYNEPATLDTAFELTDFIRSGLAKIKSSNGIWSTETELGAASTVIRWVLRLYRDVLTYRIPAIHTLKKGIEITGSEFMKLEMKNLIYRLDRIDDRSIIRESVSSFIDQKKKVINNAFDSFKRNGIKAYADDYYEIKFEIQNVDDDRAKALALLHKINARISVLDDYITSEENLSVQSVKKIQDLINKYEALREEIANKKMRSPQTLVIDMNGYYDN